MRLGPRQGLRVVDEEPFIDHYHRRLVDHGNHDTFVYLKQLSLYSFCDRATQPISTVNP